MVAQFLLFGLVTGAAWIGFLWSRRVGQVWLRRSVRLGTGVIAAAGTLALVARLPTGSIDISDLSAFLKLGVLAAVPITGFLAARWIPWAALRISVKGVSALLSLPVGFLVLFFCLSEKGCTERRPALYSPDGSHMALIEFQFQGALGDDYATVKVRHAWSPMATIAYSGLAYSSGVNELAKSPEVRWIDSSHLLVQYFDRTGRDRRIAL